MTSASHSVRSSGSGSASQMTSTSERSTLRRALSTLSSSSPLSAPMRRNSVTLERRSAEVVPAVLKLKKGSRCRRSCTWSAPSSEASTSCFSLRSMYTCAAQLYASVSKAAFAKDIHTMPPSGTSSKSAGSVLSWSYHVASRTMCVGSCANPAHSHCFTGGAEPSAGGAEPSAGGLTGSCAALRCEWMAEDCSAVAVTPALAERVLGSIARNAWALHRTEKSTTATTA
mmetsp:Transcript_48967/g.117970  ORF Transcript_48967/g.117970 Transcript_48967/m.117970 type:complete len:228 (-) Transcript_48967:142-825(-)